jgi:ribosomal protein S18 acetylase RimI-like enzyme
LKNYKISVATVEDAPALVALRTAVAQDMTRQYGEGDWSAAPTETLVVKQLRASRVLVARRENKIVGTVRLTTAQQWAFDTSAFSPARTAVYVLGLSVAPEARGQGIGSDLMDAAKESASSWPADAVWLDAYDDRAGAGAFYVRCGFREVGRTKFGTVPLIYYEFQPERRLVNPTSP